MKPLPTLRKGQVVKLKCWVGNLNGSYRGLVVATSKTKAAAVAGTTLYDFNKFWHKAISVKIGEFKPDTLYRKHFDSAEAWVEEGAGDG